MSTRNGWKVGEPYAVSKHTAYVERVVEELREAGKSYPKRPATTDQAPSTERLLAMTEEELAVYRNRPMPDTWKAIPDATTPQEAVGGRMFPVDDVVRIEEMRRAPKNQTGDVCSSGESFFSGEARASAKDAFMFSPPAELEAYQLDLVMEPKALKSAPVPRPSPEIRPQLVPRLWAYLFGGGWYND